MALKDNMDELQNSLALLIQMNSLRKQGELADDEFEEMIRQYDTTLLENQRQFDEQMKLSQSELQQQKDLLDKQLKNATDINTLNNKTSMEIADKQMNLDREMNSMNLQFQQEENAITRNREDTALQRKLQDGLNAGLSPLGALGFTGAQTSVLTSPQVNYGNSINALGNMANNLINSNNNYGNSMSNALNSYSNSLFNNTNRKINSLQNRQLMKQQAQNNYMSARSNILAQRLGIANSLISTINNFITNAQQLKVNKANINSINELTQTQKYKNDYYSKHGYTEFDLSNILTSILDANNIKKDSIPSVKKIVENVENTTPVKNLKTNFPSLDYKTQQKKWIDDLNDGDNKMAITTRTWVHNMIERYHHITLPINWYSKFKNNEQYRKTIIDLFNTALENGFR